MHWRLSWRADPAGREIADQLAAEIPPAEPPIGAQFDLFGEAA